MAFNVQLFMLTGVSPAVTLPSQAECTIGKYKKRDITCFGCGGPHFWSDWQEKNTFVISCPNQDKPGIRTAAESKIAEICTKPNKWRDDKDKDKQKKLKVSTSNAVFDSK